MLALITGASSGIGVEFARLLAINGYDLIITARREDRLTALKKTLEKMYKVSVEIFPADLSKISEVKKLAEYCFQKETDILINNAGFGILKQFEYTSDAENSKLINTNIYKEA